MARKRFGDILLDARLIAPEELERGVSAKALNADKRLGAVLVDLGILTERDVTEALGLQFMMPVVDVREYVDNTEAQDILPLDLLERLNVFPLELQDRGAILLVAISDPLDTALQDTLRKAASLDLRFALAPEKEIRGALLAVRSMSAGLEPSPQPVPAFPSEPMSSLSATPSVNPSVPASAPQPVLTLSSEPAAGLSAPLATPSVPASAPEPVLTL